MKKISIILSAFALIISGCSKEQSTSLLNIAADDDVVSFTATFEGEGPETKLGINTSSGVLSWANGDAIAVQMTDDTFVDFVYNSSTQKFTASLGGKTVKDGGVAYYPASIAKDGVPGSIDMPTSYSASVSAGVATVCPPMKATVNLGAKALSLEHLGGILSVNVSHVPADAEKLILTIPEKSVTGTITVTDDTKDYIAASTGSSTITVSFTRGAFGTTATEFFIPMPVTTFTGGFTVAFQNASDQTLYTHSTSKTSIAVGRATIKRMADLTVPVSVYINTTNIWWDDTKQKIYIEKSGDTSKYYEAWPGTEFSISATKSFTHGSNSYYRVIEDLGATMTGVTAKIIVHRGWNNSSEWPYGDMLRATLSGVDLSNDVYITISQSTSSSHRVFVSNWNNATLYYARVWDDSEHLYVISELSTAPLGDNSYHYFTTSKSTIYIYGKSEDQSWWTSESTVSTATGWDYFVKFWSDNGNFSASYGFPAVVITKD